MSKFSRIYEDGTKTAAQQETVGKAIIEAYKTNEALAVLAHSKIKYLKDGDGVVVKEIDPFPQKSYTAVKCFKCGEVDYPYKEEDNYFRCPKCGYGWRFTI